MSSLSLNKSNDTVVVNSKPFNKTRFVVSTFCVFFWIHKKINSINNFNRSPSEPQVQTISSSRGCEFTTPTCKFFKPNPTQSICNEKISYKSFQCTKTFPKTQQNHHHRPENRPHDICMIIRCIFKLKTLSVCRRLKSNQKIEWSGQFTHNLYKSIMGCSS